MAVNKEYRGKGLGRMLIKALEEHAKSIGIQTITLHGQVSAKGFYGSCGYEQNSDEVFEEEGIMHVHMVKKL